MRRSPCLLVTLLALALMPGHAHAASASPPGVNLRWDNCYGDGGAWNKNFACDTNIGSERLVGSFELDQPFAQMSGVGAHLNLSVESPTLPAWWSLSSGGCRMSSASASPVMPIGSANCIDWAQGAAAGGLAAYQVGVYGPQTARFVVEFAVADQNIVNLDPGREYFAFTLVINHAKTVGTGSCGGCDIPVCFFLSQILLVTPPMGQPCPVLVLDRGANYLGSQYVTWQNGYPINVQRETEGASLFCPRQYTVFNCVLSTPTSARGSTWGQVKSLYR
jgi:hypothetical protein